MEKLKKIKDHIRKLLFVEGDDEVSFFNELLKRELGITDIQVIDTGGKQQFKKILPVIVKAPNFENIERLGIVQDSDTDFKASFQSVCHHLEANGIIAPDNPVEFTVESPSAGIFLMPNNCDGGMLETLCLMSVQEDERMTCIDAFFECLNDLEIDKIRNIPKAKAQVFLASQKKIIQYVGLGAKKGVWNFNADCMDDLKTFLTEI